MSQHHLEEYFKQNREAFDEAIPSLKVWADIDNELDQKFKRHRPFSMYLRIAAAILVLVVAGGVMKSYVQEQGKIVSVLPAEITEAEIFYQQQFQKKYAQLVNLSYDTAIDADLEEIDGFLEEIKKELENAPKGAEPRILESLIKSYKLKIQMLDRVLDRMQEDKPLDEKIVKNESISI